MHRTEFEPVMSV